MPAPLSTALTAALAAPQRRPALSATVRRRRFGMHLLEWQRAWHDDTSDQPHAIASNSDGVVLLFRNNAGTLYYNRITGVPLARNSAGLGAWSSLAVSMASGKQFAAVAHPSNDEVLVVFGSGNALKYLRSTDGGASWGAATTIVTEASAIGAVGAAVRTSSGNVCVFYQVGAATLKRIRRSAGSWAGSGTTATPTFAGISGISSCHDGGDYAVVVSGTAVTTAIGGVWSYYMGDGNLPSNVWSSAVAVTETDTASGISYHHPAIIPFGGSAGFYLTFGQTATADVAGSRAYFATTTAPNTTSTEPAPLGETSAYGLSLAVNAAGDRAYAASSRFLAFADYGDTETLAAAVSGLTARFTARSARATVTLSDPRAAYTPSLAGSAHTLPAPLLSPGHELLLSSGYTTAAGAEYGASWTLVIDAVRVHFDRDGQRLVTVECSGPWEQLARWRVPQAWQTASGIFTRSALATRIAARAGIPLTQMSNPRQPSYVWRTHQPAFALVAGETGAAAMARLLEPVPDILRGDAPGGGVIRSIEDPRFAALVQRMAPLYWWRLDAPSGTAAAEEEQQGAALGAQGAPAFGQGGPLATQPTAACRFDGASDAFSDAPGGRVYFAAAASWTLVALARLDDAQGSDPATIAFVGDTITGGRSGFGLVIHGNWVSGGLHFGLNYENVASVTSGYAVTPGVWHLLMGGRDSGGTTFMWADGAQTAGSPAAVSAPQAPTDSFLIGAQYYYGMIRCWDGELAEVMLFDRCLVDADAEALQLARDPADWEFGDALGACPVYRWEGGDHSAPASWARIVSPTHIADAVDAESVARLGPRQRLVRVLDADNDVKAGDYADAALHGELPANAGKLSAPWHPGIELGDIVRVDVAGDGVDAALFRVIALELDYARDDRRAATCTTTLTLTTP